jgi:hypothetical protein
LNPSDMIGYHSANELHTHLVCFNVPSFLELWSIRNKEEEVTFIMGTRGPKIAAMLDTQDISIVLVRILLARVTTTRCVVDGSPNKISYKA